MNTDPHHIEQVAWLPLGISRDSLRQPSLPWSFSSWQWGFRAVACCAELEASHWTPFLLAPSRILKVLWGGWTRRDAPHARSPAVLNAPGSSGRGSLADPSGIMVVTAVSPDTPHDSPLFSEKSRFQPHFMLMGKLCWERACKTGPRLSLDLDPNTLFTRWFHACRSL